MQVGELDRSDLEAISGLCQRAVVDPPSTDELEGALFDPGQAVAVLGDPAVGVVALSECADGPHIRLLAVDPSQRNQGHGHALLDAAEAWTVAAGHRALVTGADPPYFLWPGVPTRETSLLCLFEGRHYARTETNFNMDVDLAQIPADPGGHALATPADRGDVDAFMAEQWPNWRAEVLRALDQGNLVISRDSADGRSGPVTAFCAFEVNRRGLLGPVAVRLDLMGQGRGKAALLGALHELARRGRTSISVVWVGPVVPYALVGGTVSDTFFVYRKELS
ncbi:MAG TPA: GNAT family N-acetyltransferase [Acidimicrobiales bacterium]|jgi:GNAT superfamily N-acetyltransferase